VDSFEVASIVAEAASAERLEGNPGVVRADQETALRAATRARDDRRAESVRSRCRGEKGALDGKETSANAR
jgi:hypothetical protein